MSGRLGDHSSFSVGTALNAAREFPIYATPFRKREVSPGEFGGVVRLLPGAGYHGSGTVHWSQTDPSKHHTPSDFEGPATLVVSRYTPPPRNQPPILSLAASGGIARTFLNGATLTSHYEFESIVEGDSFRSSSKSIGLTGNFFRPNGRITGSMFYPARGGRVSISGVVFQAAETAEGYFITFTGSTRTSGAFRMVPR